MRSEEHIFVGGSGRSGMTLLRRILTSHRRFATPPREARFIVDPDGLIDLVDALSTNWSPYMADIAIQGFEILMKRKLYLTAAKRVFRPLGRAASGLINIGLRISYSLHVWERLGAIKFTMIQSTGY